MKNYKRTVLTLERVLKQVEKGRSCHEVMIEFGHWENANSENCEGRRGHQEKWDGSSHSDEKFSKGRRMGNNDFGLLNVGMVHSGQILNILASVLMHVPGTGNHEHEGDWTLKLHRFKWLA